jgi:hypothetical protein
MPKAEKVNIDIGLRVAKEDAAGTGGDCFGLGKGNFPSLGYVFVRFFRSWVTVGEAKEAKAALENTLRAHLNRLAFNIYFQPPIPGGTYYN